MTAYARMLLVRWFRRPWGAGALWSMGIVPESMSAGDMVLGAATVTVLVSRSIVSRVRTITESARNVSQTQLPALVEALRDPSEDVRVNANAALEQIEDCLVTAAP